MTYLAFAKKLETVKSFIISVASILAAALLQAQSYQIGSSELTITDPARNRSIPLAVYYPANSTGVNVPFASSQFGFPVVSFGHGFVIATESYSWLWEALVPLGYIVVFPKTEGQLLPAPNHPAFGEDIAFCAREIVRRGKLSSGPLSGKVLPRIALMGHSMGGGATYLGSASASDIATTITFAAANTNPSSITAALSVQAPSMVIAAAEDCVTPVGTNQLPMYNNIPASPKAFVNITGASHCNFTDGSASACYLGEGFSCFGFGPFISRQQQHQRTLNVLIPWLDTFLKQRCDAAEAFAAALNSGSQNGNHTSLLEGAAFFQCPSECGVPGGFSLQPGGSGGGPSVMWNSVPFALGYNFEYRVNGGAILSIELSEPVLQLNAAPPPGQYEFRARAFCPNTGTGAPSEWIQAVVNP